MVAGPGGQVDDLGQVMEQWMGVAGVQPVTAAQCHGEGPVVPDGVGDEQLGVLQRIAGGLGQRRRRAVGEAVPVAVREEHHVADPERDGGAAGE
nr:hypothetical protein GCM10020093_025310 [Planobispora longispora]